jgi:lysophospholipase L1-like esterase
VGSLLARLDRDDPETIDGSIFGFDPVAQEALATQPDARELMAQLDAAGLGRRDPFIGWRFASDVTTQSSLVNVVDGVRATRATALDGPALDVWFFGGSTLYGAGQSDLATIPSALVERLDAQGIAINATNFGHPAYAQWQQVQLLEAELSAGTRAAPDLVVFYDGFNDLTLQTQLGVHDQPTHLFFELWLPPIDTTETSVATTVRSWWADHSAASLAVGRVRETFDDEPTIQVADVEAAPIESIDPIAAGNAAADIHRRGVDHVVALGRAYGFDTRFFWQPYLYTKDPLTPAEQDLVGLPGYDTDVWFPMTDQVRSQLSAPIIDISDALDGAASSVFWDFVHTNERGAALVADAMLADLEEALG